MQTAIRTLGVRKLGAKGIAHLLSEFLPPKIKRLMFVYSVLGFVQNNAKDDQSTIASVNNILRLSKSVEACSFPLAIKSMIWSGSGVQSVTLSNFSQDSGLTDVTSMATPWDKDSLANYFISHCPTWLRYGDTSDMRRDLTRLFTELNK